MSLMIKFIRKNILIFLVISLTLGLARFTPEPHIVGKIRWIWGGAVGMKVMDWFDFFLHATPFIFLFVSLGLRLAKRASSY